MCEFILIVFIAVSVLMPKLCFRQRLLKLWSPCKKHPWNESHSLSNQFVQNVNTHWYPENRAGVVNAYLSTVIPISDIHFFYTQKNISSVCGFKENPEQCELKVKTEYIDISVSVCPPGGAKAPVAAALILCYRCSWKTSLASLCCVFNMQLKTKSGLRGQTLGNI